MGCPVMAQSGARRWAVLLMFAVPTLGAAQEAVMIPPAATIPEELEDQWRRFEMAWRADSASAFDGVFIDDAVVVPTHGIYRGRSEIYRSWIQPGLNVASGFCAVAYHFVGGGELIHDTGGWAETVELASGGRRPVSGIYTRAWVRTEEGWKISSLTVKSDREFRDRCEQEIRNGA